MAHIIVVVFSIVFYLFAKDKIFDYPVNPKGMWQHIPRMFWFLTSMKRVHIFITAVFIGVYSLYVVPESSNLLMLLLGAALLNLIALQTTIDIHSHLLPNKYNKYIGVVGVLYIFINGTYISSLISVLTIFTLTLILSLVRVRGVNGIGAGDVKYVAVLSMFLTVGSSLYGILLGFVIGGVAILFLLLGGFVKRSEGVPYGPFLSIGYLIVFVKEGVFIG